MKRAAKFYISFFCLFFIDSEVFAIDNYAALTCNNQQLNYTPPGSVPSLTYTWTVVENPNITGSSNQTTPQTSLNQLLINHTIAPAVVVYTVTNSAGVIFTVEVTVNPSSVGGTVIGGSTICSGSPGGNLVLTGNTGKVIRWESSLDSVGWTAINRTDSNYTPINVTQDTWYRTIVSYSGCDTVASSPTKINISATSIGGTVAGESAICSGTIPGVLTLTGNVGIILRWESSIDGSTAWSSINVIANTYAPSSLVSSQYFRAIVKNGACAEAASSLHKIIVSQGSVGGTVTGGTEICIGNTSGTLTLTGYTGNIIKWQSSKDGSSWTDIVNTANTYTSAALTESTWFRAVVKNGICNDAYSIGTLVSVTPVSNGGIVNTSKNVCIGSDAGALTVTGHLGNVVRWESSPDNSAWSAIANTTTSLTLGILNASAYYRAIVKNGECAAKESTPAIITIDPSSIGGSVAGGSTVCAGSVSGLLTLTGQLGNVVKWQYLPNGGGWTDIVNESANYTSTPLNVKTEFRAVIKNGTCNVAYSTATVVDIDVASVGGTITGSVAVCKGSTSGELKLTGQLGTIKRWQSSLDGTNWTDIVNSATIYTSDALTTTTRFRAVVQNGSCAEVFSTVKTVLVSDSSKGGTISGSATVCSGKTAGTLTLSGHVGTVDKWQSSVDAISWVDIANTTNLYSTPVLNNTVYYKAIVHNSTCPAVASASTQVAVIGLPIMSSSLTPTAMCSSTAFVYTAETGDIGTTFNWTRNAVLGISNAQSSGNSVAAINEVLVNSTNNPVNAIYKFILTNGSCTNAQDVIVKVNPTPTLSSATTNTVCSGSAFAYIPTSGVAGTSFSWKRAAVLGISNAPVENGVGNISEVLTNLTHDAIKVTYEITLVANGCSHVQEIDVWVSPTPYLTSSTSLIDVCSGKVFDYTATSETPGVVYKWSRASIVGIANTAINNVPQNKILEILTNTTTNPITVTYKLLLTANGCENVQDVMVDVKPKPSLNTTLTPPAVCSKKTFTYTANSSTADVSYSWVREPVIGIRNILGTGTNVHEINEQLEDTTTGAVSVVYKFTLTANGCTNEQSVTVVINPLPKLSSSKTTNSICSGTGFLYNASSETSGVTFAWERSALVGISNGSNSGNSASIFETLVNNTADLINVPYKIAMTANGCINADTVTVGINPIPLLTSNLIITDKCSNELINYAATSASNGVQFNWKRAADAYNSIGTGSSLDGILNERLLNKGVVPLVVNYVYSLRNVFSTCENTQTVSVTVYPKPALSSSLTPSAVCSGTTFNYLPVSSASPDVSFTWSRPSVIGINSGFSQTGTGAISEVLVNTTNTAIEVRYEYTLTNTITHCDTVQVVKVMVYPKPKLESNTFAVDEVCSGSAHHHNIYSNQDPSVTASWYRAAVPGITNQAKYGSIEIIDTLINSTAVTIPVSYAISLKNITTNCTMDTNMIVNIKPMPVLTSSTNTVAICSGNIFTYSPITSILGTAITWTRGQVSTPESLSPPAAAGNGNISETLINGSDTLPANVTYQFELSKDGCINIQNLLVKVNPTPTLKGDNIISMICSGSKYTFVPESDQSDITFKWSRNAVVGIQNSANSGTGVIDETLINNTLKSIVVAYTIELKNTITGCKHSQDTSVIVNPIPQISNKGPIIACNGTSFVVPNITEADGAAIGTTYTWSMPTITATGTIIGAAAQTNGLPYISQKLTNSGSTTAALVYTVTPNTFGCPGSPFTVAVNVASGAGSTIQLSSSLTPPAMCSGTLVDYNPESNAPSPTFTWTRYYVAGIINPPASGVGNPRDATTKEILVNSTNLPVIVTYAFTTTSMGCSNTEAVNVQVNPSAGLLPTHTQIICSNTVFSFNPASNTSSPTTVFSWSRDEVVGISNPANSGSNNPQETLINTTSHSVNVWYIYTLNTPANCEIKDSISVEVLPSPKLNSSKTPAAVCSDNTFNYTPTSATAFSSFTWSRAAQNGIVNPALIGNGSPNESLTNSGDTSVFVTYLFTTKANICSSTEAVVVEVKPVPVIQNINQSICSNTQFDGTPVHAPIGVTYTWGTPVSIPSAAVTGAAAGNSQLLIAQNLFNTTTDPAIMVYTVTPTAKGCAGNSFDVTITVNPKPNASNVTLPLAMCSGVSFSYIPPNIQTGTKYSWNAPVVSPAGRVVGGLAASAQSSIGQLLTNLNTTQSQAVYTVTPEANGCIGSDFTVTVPVNPTPIINDTIAVLCSGGSFTITPTNVPVGTKYSWNLPVQSPAGVIVGATANIFPVAGSISQTLINTTNNIANVLYQVIPVAGTCVGDTFSMAVSIHPSTQLISSLTPPAICSGSTFSYTPQSNTASTSFLWNRAIVSGVTNLTGSGSNNPNETLINSTTTPKHVKYVYNLKTAGNCMQTAEVTVVVNPIPILSNSLFDTAICSGAPFVYVPKSVTRDSSITWSRTVVNGVTNASNSGMGNPFEYLVNNTTSPITVVYNFTTTANGCSSSQSTNVIVKPTPVVSAQTKKVCSNETFTIAPVNVPLNTQYTWVSAVSNPMGVITVVDGTLQNSIVQKLINGTNSAATATYSITPTADGCVGNAFMLVATVNPIPVVNDSIITAVCSGTTFAYRPINIPLSTKFSWNNPVIGASNSLTGWSSLSAQTDVIQKINSASSLTDTAVYTVIPNADGCIGRSFKLTVPIAAAPIISDQVFSICTGNSFSFMPATVPATTTYSWPAPVQNPAGTINGGYSSPTSSEVVISQVLTNTTAFASKAIYTVTPEAGQCLGTPFTITVNVSPYAQLTSSLIPAAVCSESIFTYIPTSTPSSAVAQWERNVVSGINNGANNGTGNISETLINTTSNPILVDYKYIVQSAGSCTNIQHVKVTVNPLPVLNSTSITAPVCSGNIFSYTPTSLTLDSSITWERSEMPGIANGYKTGVGNPFETLVNTTINTVNVAYKFKVASNGCSSYKQIEVMVKPTPTVAPQTVSICSNNTINLKPGLIPTNTLFSWSSPVSNPIGAVTGTSGVLQSSVLQTLSNPTVNGATVSYIVKPVADGCVGNDFTIVATVNPVPVVTDTTVPAICSGTQLVFRPIDIPTSTLLSWGNPDIQPANGVMGASIETGQYQLKQSLTVMNKAQNLVSYLITPTSNGCVGNPFTLKIPVKPTPIIADKSVTICSGNNFLVSPVEVPAGTTYKWSTPIQTPVGTISGGNSQNSPALEISQKLYNTTTNLSQLLYTVTPSTSSCVGATFNVVVAVNPVATLNLTLLPDPICTNTVFNYLAASNTSNTSFTWSRVVVAGIANSASTGINNPAEKLVNNTGVPIDVIYRYNLVTDRGCANFQDVTVTVKPTPALTSVSNPAAVCSGNIFNYTPTANIAGTVFNWSRNIQPSIGNNYSSGSFDPNEVLINTSLVPANVTYDYLLTYNGCSANYPVKTTVNPTPFLTPQQVTACSDASFTLAGVAVPAGTLYMWGMPVYVQAGTIAGGSSQLVTPTNFSQKLANLTTANVYANYSITPITGSCEGVPFSLTVNLNPQPTAPDTTIAKICANTNFVFKPANMPVGTLYTWSNPIYNPSGGLTGGSAEQVPQLEISQKLINTNTAVNRAIYAVMPILNNCLGKEFTLTVPVDPIPNVQDIVYNACTGTAIVIVPDNVPVGTNYTWSLPEVLPFGTIVGTKKQNVPVNTFSQTLLNTTSRPAKATYPVIPSVGNCVGIPFNIIVNVGVQLPIVPDQFTEVCSGDLFNATPNSMPRGTKYSWTMPSDNPLGTVFGINEAVDPVDSIQQTLFNYTANKGIATYLVTPSNAGCIGNSFKALVTVLAKPQVLLNGKKVTCRYPIDTLSMSFVGTAPWSFSYKLDNGMPINISGITTSPYMHPLPLATPLTVRKFSITDIAYQGCVNTDDTSYFVQTVNASPAPGTIHSLHGKYICSDKLDTLFITVPDNVTYQWTLDGNLLAGKTHDSLFTALPGKYNAILKNVFGCIDTITPPFTIEKIIKPTLQFSYDSYCINTPVRFKNLTNTNATGKIKWSWDFGNGSTDTATSPATVYTLGGSHHIQLKGFQEYCANDSVIIDSTIDIQIPIPGITMPSENAYSTIAKPLNARQLNNYRYRWTPSWGIDFPDRPMVNFNYTKTQQYVVELISTGGCITHDSLLVRVYDDSKFVEMIVPKSFTPNGDGVNDVLYPYLAGVKQMLSFRIFNRYNQLMYESTNHDQGWNGMVNGTVQPMGIYIWIAEGIANDGSTIKRTGQTLLLR